mmetsp:Transcript_27617/g.55398  ORF Transcript_27617/g.55398 Transcript_27617/m.55398 type:complete len:219 (-) Transcript_27617:161-817(-)|eukprot:scaffold18361_cov66-Skeletonema_marinoi.AAC.1
MTKTFTEELRAAAGDQWDRVINHRFTTELARGDIDRNVLKKYLIQDHRFLDAFVVLLASAIAKARDLDDRIPGCQFLGLITGKENTYFERCFVELGCGKEERAKIPDEDVTKGFANLMREVSYKGTLGEILSVLVVAEWSYQSWGEKVLPITNRDDFLTYEWVDLHSGDYFRDVVSYLRGLLDKEGTLIDDEGKEKCKAAFLRAIQLEEDFFEMAYAA